MYDEIGHLAKDYYCHVFRTNPILVVGGKGSTSGAEA